MAYRLLTNLTAKLSTDYRKQPEPKRNKYHAVKVQLDGYTFDSKAEAKRYTELKLLQQHGEIYGLVVHPEFLLQQAVQDGLKVIRPIIYEADFAYWEEGRLHTEDVKGVATKEFRIKEKMFRERFPEHDFQVIRKGK